VTSIELRQQRVQAGALFEEYAERLLAYCQRRLGSRSEAEDAVQTTFLYAHRALQRGVVPDSDSAWLFAIAKNVCRWQQRTLLRRAPVADEYEADWLPARPAPELDAHDLTSDLDDALATIPERQRQAFVLREWRGLSCEEIASRLDMSESATQSLITRARRSIVSALSAAGRRPVLGLDFGSVLSQLRGLLAGSAAKVVVGVVAVVGTGAAGVSVERALTRPHVDRAPTVKGLIEARADQETGATGTSLEGARTRPGRVLGGSPSSEGSADAPQPGSHDLPAVVQAAPGSGRPVGLTPPETTLAPASSTEATRPKETATEESVETVNETVDELLAPLEPPPTPELEVTVEVEPPPVSVPVLPGVEVQVPEASATVSAPDTSDVVTGLLP
jgi:RNA polymerase sigma-70 factor (ECF subfamily)